MIPVIVGAIAGAVLGWVIGARNQRVTRPSWVNTPEGPQPVRPFYRPWLEQAFSPEALMIAHIMQEFPGLRLVESDEDNVVCFYGPPDVLDALAKAVKDKFR
jgi:hypothetical protein